MFDLQTNFEKGRLRSNRTWLLRAMQKRANGRAECPVRLLLPVAPSIGRPDLACQRIRDDLPGNRPQNRDPVLQPQRRAYRVSRELRFSVRHSDNQALL